MSLGAYSKHANQDTPISTKNEDDAFTTQSLHRALDATSRTLSSSDLTEEEQENVSDCNGIDDPVVALTKDICDARKALYIVTEERDAEGETADAACPARMDREFLEATIRLIKAERKFRAFNDEVMDASKFLHAVKVQKLRRENRKLAPGNKVSWADCETLLSKCERGEEDEKKAIAEVIGLLEQIEKKSAARQNGAKAYIKALEADVADLRCELARRAG